ncbi:NACHT, LRR and PYD domains-containing protein 3-like isoform X3 [Rana temporaria]|uniref:NACHT, LRR and PYD domains-containing protein 3-like isoform X3 n=1 Tax=Rana temporaria TaxID=8407 RepID=UPI001AADFCDF|nr:NACHT, LRR and PYD domains-containing protein 3-like isoform X3 [Rana temporaria]
MAERLIKEKRRVTPEDIGRFRHRLSAYDDPSLRKIYEYYRDDLTYILENMGPRTALVELKSRNVLNTEKYEPMEKDPSSFSYTLLQDIRDRGREAVIGLWECLYVLQDDDHHPNLLAVLDEITQRGEGLVDQILLDEHGHSLIPELRDIQEKHKQHLMEKTETLEEHRPPGTTLEPQRFLINERYVKLIVVSTVQFRERSRNELIQTGVKHEECLKETQTRLEHISSNKLFRWNPQSHSVPRAVMVSGVPGIGKTTLMQKFVYDWVTGKHYQRFAFLFFFRFRELNRLGEVSLEEMILHQYPYLESQIGDILQDPERLLFIFDGLDESLHQINFTSSKLSNPKQRSHFGEIVVSLVRQSLLKGCSVLMTSRPTRLASVNTDVFQRIAEIMGFLHGDRQIFFNNFFGNEELSEKAFHYVQENDTLYTFCYIPSYCWIICTVLSMCFRSQPITDQLMTSLPKTMTQLFVTFVSNILTNHSQNKDGGHTDRELLTSIGWMAEHGVMNHMIVFDERHLESFKVRNDDHLFSSFMMETGQPPDVDYTFLHLTLQEFFAALVNLINYNSKRLQETLDTAESYKDGRGEILLRFLCGLSDSSTRSLLKSHVGELSTQAAGDVITWIQKKLPEQIPDKPIRGSRELLSVFYYLYESRNKALVSQCIGSNKGDFSKVPLSPLDCSVLSFILPSCREIEEIDLTSCNVQSEGLRKFIPALHNIKRLRLEDNHLTDSSSPHLASGIRNNRTLRTLNLSVNNLEGPHFRDLMEALTTSRIKELQLSSNQLTDSSSPHLASGIRNNRTLRTLDLSRNNLEGPHFRDLMESLATSRIEELQLDGNRLTDSSSPHLTSGIRNNQTLRTLNLSWNNLEGPHFRDLMESLTTSRIEELQLWDNHLTDSFCPHLTSGIRNNQTLRTLNLSKNNLEGPHFRDLMESLTTSRIEELQLEDNHLTDSSSSHLASGIRNNQTLRTLDLSGNNLEGPHFRDLMESLATSRIEELQVYRREYRHLLAFIFAIDEINRSPDILPNITLGYHVYDSCGHVNKAIKDVLQILSGHTKEAPNYSCMERGALAGFIGDLNSDTTLQMAQLLNLYGYTQVPRGQCSEECLPGFRKSVREGYHPCCYNCAPCSEGEISNQSDSENCMKCPDEEWPNEKKDRCVPRVVEFLSYTDDPIVGVFSAVSILCCLLTGLILVIFIHYQDTPIVKANNRDLSYLLLVSIMLSFLCVFLFLGHPVDVTCMLRVTSFGVIFSVAVSSLLAKSIMVCIAFKSTKPGSPWRKWMGAKLSNSIICIFSLVQLIICITWLSISPPFQDWDIHSYQGKIIIQCNEGSVIGFYSVLGYMGLLAAVSFIIAFVARTLPDSFNEAKYITFSMLVFCSVWIAMIPAYLSTRGKYMVAVEVFAIMASSSGLLGCIFFPKCYIILFRPDQNTKTAIH